MKKLTLFIVLSIIICFSCKDKEPGKVVFRPLADTELKYGDSSFNLPADKRFVEWKGLHDSCMGVQFPANAVFFQREDSIRLGSIVNRKTMRVIKELNFQAIPPGAFFQLISFITRPCYQVMPMNIPVKGFFRREMKIVLPAPYEKLTGELNDVVNNAVNNTVEMGAWLNGELTTALGAMLDTAKNEEGLAYKAMLTDTANMVLMRSANITNITFHITAKQPISRQLQNMLHQKIIATVENSRFRAQLFYIDENNLQINFMGMLQAMGQFMACRLQ